MGDATETTSGATYELSFLQRGEDPNTLKQIFAGKGATVIAERPLEKIRLAYPIRKQAYAFLGSVQFSVASGALAVIDGELKVSDQILRHLISRATLRAETLPEPTRPAVPRVHATRLGRKTLEPTLTNEDLERKIEEILR